VTADGGTAAWGGRLPGEAGGRAGEWFRHNWHFVVLTGWVMAWFLAMAPHGGIAWVFFERGTAGLFGGHGTFRHPGGLHLYASNPYLQIGPLSFAVAEALRHLGPHNGILTAEAVLAAAGLLAVASIEDLARKMRPDLRCRPMALQLTVLIGGAAFLNAWADLAVGYTHLDDGLALLFAIGAFRAALANRPVLAGLSAGLAADAKPWALVFLAVLLLLPASGWWRGAGAALAAMAAAWLPFLIADHGTMAAAHYAIGNMRSSALRALGVTAARTPAWDRPAQVLLGWALSAVAVWRRRWPAVILLGVGARIALDPGVHAYYTAGIVAGALIWDTMGARRPAPLWSLLSILALTVLPHLTRRPDILGDARLALVLAFTAALLLAPDRWTGPAGQAEPDVRQPDSMVAG
jgi:hypothetical protein